MLIRRSTDKGEFTHAVHFSDAIDNDRLHPHVGNYRMDVTEPLRRLHLTVADTGASPSIWNGTGCST